MVSPTQRPIYVSVALVAALTLLAAVGRGSTPASAANPMTHIAANLNDDCIDGFFWPASKPVHVEVRDSGGSIVYAKTVSTDSAGTLQNVGGVDYDKGGCQIPDLRPGMKVTASDGATTKVLVLESVTFDELDPATLRAAGTAPPGRTIGVYIYPSAIGQQNFNVDPSGNWSVDIGALGGRLDDPASFGDVFLGDDGADGNYDYTSADRFLTGLSLGVSSPASAASAAGSAAVTTVVRRPASAASAAGNGAAGPTVVRRGSRVRLSGMLSAGSGACVGRKRVKLLEVRRGRSKAVKSARTNRSGRYSFVRKVKRTTRFRVRYAGNRRCQRSRSRVRVVQVARS
ncbi:MAG: hypothetical protein M3R70_01300 [Actinomycetota bacterium]|nr:hypothetical protein [Actinomycetota bacterium]